MNTLLHVGCGPKSLPQTTPFFASGGWKELRLDINPEVKPDVVGSLTDMSAVESGSIDAVFSSHNLEHLYPHEVGVALGEMHRVLKPEGILIVTCPDLQSIARLIADDKLLEPAYQSPVGPISPLDMLYGHRASIARGNVFMAHRCGFTLRVLIGVLRAAGFPAISGTAIPGRFEIWTAATRNARNEQEMRELLLAQFARPLPETGKGGDDGKRN